MGDKTYPYNYDRYEMINTKTKVAVLSEIVCLTLPLLSTHMAIRGATVL